MAAILVGATVINAPSVMSAEFANLNFESANLPFIPRGEFGTWQPTSMAIPGWQIFLGADSYGFALHNNATLGTASVSIYGPDWGASILEGRHSVFLGPGASPSSGTPVDVTIAQSGVVPAGAQSLRFFGLTSQQPTTQQRFGVFVNGQHLDTFLLASGEQFNIYGADVSVFSGQEVSLRFTAFTIPRVPNGFGLDAITFSSVPVPEPSTWALLGLYAVALRYHLRRRAS